MFLLLALSAAVSAGLSPTKESKVPHNKKCIAHPFRHYHGGPFKSIRNVHIPKTAGTSFTQDTMHVLRNTYGDDVKGAGAENCFEEMAGADFYTTSMFRHPRGHVYSMYLQNRASQPCHVPGREVSPEEGFAAWVDHFHKGLSDDGSMNETYSFGCYHPYNFQSRVFSPLCTKLNNTNKRCARQGSHFYSPDIQNVETMKHHLADNMYKLNWLGLTEYYTASLCMYQELVGVASFDSCDAGKYYRDKLSKLELSGGGGGVAGRYRWVDGQPSRANAKKPHPHLSVSDEVWRKVDDLTYFDRKLYYMAMRRFACGVQAYEQQANHSLQHLMPAGGWEYLYDVSDAFIKTSARGSFQKVSHSNSGK